MRSTEPTERRRPGRSRPSLAVVVLACTVALALSVATVATPIAAHAYLSESDPANGEQVETIPDGVTLYFSGDGIPVADVTVTGPDGDDVSGAAEIDPDDAKVVRIPIEEADAGEGMYTVRWEVLADDGHTASGSFFFTVGDEPLDRDAVLEAYEDDGDEDVSPVEAGAKGLLLVALVGLVGIPLTARVVVYPATGSVGTSPAAADRRLTQLLAGASVLLAASVLALGFARIASLGSFSTDTVAQFVETPLGRVWLVQLLLASTVAAGFAVAVRGGLARRVRIGIALVGGILVQASVSWTSHSATAIDRLSGMAIDFVHIAGAGFWVGGLLVLAVVVPPLLRETDPADREAFAAETIRRFSIVALTGVTLAVVSGLLLAAWHAPTIEGLSETLYGTALSVKTLLVLVALGLAGFTRFALLRVLDPGTEAGGIGGRLFGRGTDAETGVRKDGGKTGTVVAFTRTVRFEVAVLIIVVVLSGLLTTAPTAAVAGADTGPQRATLGQQVNDVGIELSAIPAEEARETIHVRENEPVVFEVAFTSDGERVRSDRPVRLLAHSERHDVRMEIELEETDDGTYATVQTLPEPDAWEIRVSGAPAGTYVSEWFDAYTVPEHPAHDHEDGDDTGADTPFAMFLRLGALAVGVVGSLAVAFEAIRFGRRQR